MTSLADLTRERRLANVHLFAVLLLGGNQIGALARERRKAST